MAPAQVKKKKKKEPKVTGCGFISVDVYNARKEEKAQKEADGKSLRFNGNDKDLIKCYFQGKGLAGKFNFERFQKSVDYCQEIQGMEPHWLLIPPNNWSQTCRCLASKWQANKVRRASGKGSDSSGSNDEDENKDDGDDDDDDDGDGNSDNDSSSGDDGFGSELLCFASACKDTN